MLRDNLSQRERRHQGSKPEVQWVVGVIKINIKISKLENSARSSERRMVQKLLKVQKGQLGGL